MPIDADGRAGRAPAPESQGPETRVARKRTTLSIVDRMLWRALSDVRTMQKVERTLRAGMHEAVSHC